MASNEQVSWILRHVGPPPTIKGIVEVVELKHGSTRFGRGAEVDVYIDSLVLRNFISRLHAVITGETTRDGQLQFVLHNHGLNGTYVNDIRIGKQRRLQEGDRVIFGHTNGYKVKVGETASQPNSEFQFVLECVKSGKTSVAPLQEHRQQKGGVPDSTHIPPAAVYTPRWNGQTAADDPGHSETAISRQRTPAKASGGSPTNIKQSSSETAVGVEKDAGGSSVNGGGGESGDRGKVSEICAASKENTQAALSRKKVNDGDENLSSLRLSDDVTPRRPSNDNAANEPRNKAEDNELPDIKAEKTSPTKDALESVKGGGLGGGDDGSTKSLTTNSRAKSKSKSPTANSVSESAKQGGKQKSASPRRIEKRKSASPRRGESRPNYRRNSSPRRSSNENSSSLQRRDRLGQTHGEDSRYRSRSPLRKDTDADRSTPSSSKHGAYPKSRRSKSPPSPPKNTDPNKGSRSSRPVLERSGSPTPILSRPDLERTESKSTKVRRKRSRSERSSSGSSSRSSSSSGSEQSFYDEPPVLSPEYVKTPSSNVRTPSPAIVSDDDDDADEVDMDRDYRVPPTPGQSLRDLSPAPHCKRDPSPHRKTRDVSPQVRKWLLSSKPPEGSGRGERTGARRSNSPPSRNKGGGVDRDSAVEDSGSKKQKGEPMSEEGHSGLSRPCHLEADSAASRHRNSSELSNSERKKSDDESVKIKEESSNKSLEDVRDRDVRDRNSAAKASKKDVERDSKNGRGSREGRESSSSRTSKDREKDGKYDRDRRKTPENADRRKTPENAERDETFRPRPGGGGEKQKHGSKDRTNSNKLSVNNPHPRSSKSPSSHGNRSSSSRRSRDSSDGSRGGSASPTKSSSDRNVFEQFWARRNRKSDPVAPEKRRHSTASEGSSDERLRPQVKAVKVEPAAHRGRADVKANGLDNDSSKRKNDSRDKTKQISDGKLLKDVRVSVHKVTSKELQNSSKSIKHGAPYTTTTDRSRDSSSNNRTKDVTSSRNTSSNSSNKPPTKTITRRVENEGESLFGSQLQSVGVGAVQQKDRSRKTHKDDKDKERSLSFIRSSRDVFSKGPRDGKSRGGETMKQNARGPERDRSRSSRSSERQVGGGQSSSKSRSQTPDPEERSRSARKVAMRRPRQRRPSGASQGQETSRSTERRSAGPSGSNQRPKGQKKRRRKKNENDVDPDDDDDEFGDEDDEAYEDLPDGVTWYEEDTCDSHHCLRPTTKRVQWVCCDDCNKWYHTVCLGIRDSDFEELKEDEDFHCGCKKDRG